MSKILIIDDDVSIQKLFSQFLSGRGYEVVQAENGVEGMHLLESQRPDLVITDILMPEMDGLEILMKIRKSQSTTPIIAISGGMRGLPIDFLHQAKLFGAKYVFEKPVPLDVLGSVVAELLGDGTP